MVLAADGRDELKDGIKKPPEASHALQLLPIKAMLDLGPSKKHPNRAIIEVVKSSVAVDLREDHEHVPGVVYLGVSRAVKIEDLVVQVGLGRRDGAARVHGRSIRTRWQTPCLTVA